MKPEPIMNRNQWNRSTEPNWWNRKRGAIEPVEPARTKPVCTVLYSTVQYCTVLYSTVQYCAVLCSTVQYCAVLYSTETLLWMLDLVLPRMSILEGVRT